MKVVKVLFVCILAHILLIHCTNDASVYLHVNMAAIKKVYCLAETLALLPQCKEVEGLSAAHWGLTVATQRDS